MNPTILALMLYGGSIGAVALGYSIAMALR